jgi:hypothetical protein
LALLEDGSALGLDGAGDGLQASVDAFLLLQQFPQVSLLLLEFEVGVGQGLAEGAGGPELGIFDFEGPLGGLEDGG